MAKKVVFPGEGREPQSATASLGGRKGIILAGGSGTRLYPITLGMSKHLLPVYDKPMIYYPLSVLLLTGIRDILIISTPQDLPLYERSLGTGKQWGVSLQYLPQPKPEGIAQSFLIARSFLNDQPACLILGDNIFYGQGLSEMLSRANSRMEGATLFGYLVGSPERYGVVAFGKEGNVLSIEEKPKKPKSNYAVSGLYFYDKNVVDYAKQMRPSDRGELEITDLNNVYLQQNRLHIEKMGRGMAWLDMGTHESLLSASNFIETIQSRQGVQVACLEEIAYTMGYIDAEQVLSRARLFNKTEYGIYLEKLVETRGK
jgi:glucose-1-phosphate thymidylyltransferase